MIHYLPVILITCLLFAVSCSTKIISTNIYQEQKEDLDNIERRYEKLNPQIILVLPILIKILA
jgi:hypothetical protein